MGPRGNKSLKIDIQGNLHVIFMEQCKKIVAFAPALDLATSANTLEEAKKRFGEVLEIFFEETLKKGTLEQVLAECGWRKVSRPKKHWVPPRTHVVGQESIPICLPT